MEEEHCVGWSQWSWVCWVGLDRQAMAPQQTRGGPLTHHAARDLRWA